MIFQFWIVDSRAQRCPIPPDPFSRLFTRRYQVQNLSFALGGVAQKNLLLSITTPLTVACSQCSSTSNFRKSENSFLISTYVPDPSDLISLKFAKFTYDLLKMLLYFALLGYSEDSLKLFLSNACFISYLRKISYFW